MEGGEVVGKRLRAAVQDYHKNNNANYHPDDRIVIRVFSNSRGLSRTYKAAKIIPDEVVFELFMTGFSKSHPLSDFIDAGNQKEAADSKMKGMLSPRFARVWS